MIVKKSLKVNGAIRADTVRLIDEGNNQVGIVDKLQAMSIAREAGLDLVEVAPTSEPPVCRIMDYGKWLYQQKRKFRESKKKSHQHSTTLKEIRFRFETDKHDLDIKLKHSRDFLQKGHKVQFTMFLRGRQMLHKDRGYQTFDHIVQTLEDLAKIERPSKMVGKRITLLLIPR